MCFPILFQEMQAIEDKEENAQLGLNQVGGSSSCSGVSPYLKYSKTNRFVNRLPAFYFHE